MLLVLAYLASSLVAPLPSTMPVAAKAQSLAQPAAALSWPGFGASAVSVLDYPGVSESHGSTSSMPIASMTKTITALVVLSAKPIASGSQGANITFTQSDVDILNQVIAEDGSWAPVVAGSTMTEKQALESMLLPSANNYAISLANWSYGSVGAFLTAANAWLAKNKLTGTHLVDPAGLDPGSVSTTADLMSIGKMVLADPTLSSIVNQKTATVPGAGTLKNTNALLGTDGIDGIKTGNTDQAGFCLMFSAHITVGTTTLRVLGVVLDAGSHPQLWASVKELLASVKSGFHEVELTHAGEKYGTYTTAWGAKTSLVAAEAKSTLVWSNTPITVAVQAQPVALGVAGDEVGTVTFTHSGTTQSVPLKLKTTIAPPGLGWRLGHPRAFA